MYSQETGRNNTYRMAGKIIQLRNTGRQGGMQIQSHNEQIKNANLNTLGNQTY